MIFYRLWKTLEISFARLASAPKELISITSYILAVCLNSVLPMLCFNSHTQQQKQCIYKMILQSFIMATQRRITLRLFQNEVIVMKSFNNLTKLLYFNQCSSAEQVERLVLTGRNLPLGDGWACQIRDSLIKSIDSEFNFSDHMHHEQRCMCRHMLTH